LKPTEKQEIHQVNEYENMSREDLQAQLDELRDAWLEDYLNANDCEVVSKSSLETVEAVLEHEVEKFDGKQDH
jgi:flagellar motor component MotA